MSNREYAEYDNSNKIYNYDNIVLMAHPKDESVFFFNYITNKTLVILLANSNQDLNNNIMKSFMLKRGATLVCLNDIEDFDVTYEISNKLKMIIKEYIDVSNFEKIITHTKIKIETDVQNRRLYEFVRSLKLNNHYTIVYDSTLPLRKLQTQQMVWLKKYSNLYQEKKNVFELYSETASFVRGINKMN